MLNAIPHTFIDIFFENPAESDDIAIRKIVIPIIQRDYAQGRENDEVNRIRSRFLDALHQALTENSPITLDFVYGEIDKSGDLVPLDGQQRLTTLFLLHWYVIKHESVDAEKGSFLGRFSYDTRYSAREFCELLSNYTPDFEAALLSKDILDQPWFPMDWTSDPTIASMLVMIDAIHDKFKDTSGIWEKLEKGYISFYFLPLKDMGLTDELYIKMNSRGKPLTQFEHFKAELERAMKQVDKGVSERISRKIDLSWTDMLWPYKGDNQIIDDEFIRYFHFICDIINYLDEKPLIEDPFVMVQELFSVSNPKALDNMLYVEKMFDCWCDVKNAYKSVDDFFEEYLTTGEHNANKSIVGKMTNLFLDCCNVYGEMQGARIRRFPIGRTILLYTFILYLQNKDSITNEAFIKRLRIVNNMVRASEFELRDDRMKTLLSQTRDIIVKGVVEETDKSFNINQILEEVEKNEWLGVHPEEEALMRKAEDHRLLNGAIRVIGVENIRLYPKFEQLFLCDLDKVDRALLTIGDYSQFIRWRYQIGSSKMDSVWRDLFNTSKEDMVRTKAVLLQLLAKADGFTDEVLDKIIEEYMALNPVLDWRYYIVNYKSMRPERYGMYVWAGEGKAEKKSRIIYMMTTEKSIAGWNYNIFLKTIYDELILDLPNLYLGTYAYQHDGDKLIINSNLAISCDESSFTIYKVHEDRSYEEIAQKEIPQNPLTETDAEDRVVIGKQLVLELYS